MRSNLSKTMPMPNPHSVEPIESSISVPVSEAPAHRIPHDHQSDFPLPDFNLKKVFIPDIDNPMDKHQFAHLGLAHEYYSQLIEPTAWLEVLTIQALGKIFITDTNYVYINMFLHPRTGFPSVIACLIDQIALKLARDRAAGETIQLQGIIYTLLWRDHFTGIALDEDGIHRFENTIQAGTRMDQEWMQYLKSHLTKLRTTLEHVLIHAEGIANEMKNERKKKKYHYTVEILDAATKALKDLVHNLIQLKQLDHNIINTSTSTIITEACVPQQDDYSCGCLVLQSLILYSHHRPCASEDVYTDKGEKLKKYFLAILAGKLSHNQIYAYGHHEEQHVQVQVQCQKFNPASTRLAIEIEDYYNIISS
jgi:hypothetical protein